MGHYFLDTQYNPAKWHRSKHELDNLIHLRKRALTSDSMSSMKPI